MPGGCELRESSDSCKQFLRSFRERKVEPVRGREVHEDFCIFPHGIRNGKSDSICETDPCKGKMIQFVGQIQSNLGIDVRFKD